MSYKIEQEGRNLVQSANRFEQERAMRNKCHMAQSTTELSSLNNRNLAANAVRHKNQLYQSAAESTKSQPSNSKSQEQVKTKKFDFSNICYQNEAAQTVQSSSSSQYYQSLNRDTNILMDHSIGNLKEALHKLQLRDAVHRQEILKLKKLNDDMQTQLDAANNRNEYILKEREKDK